MPIHLPLRQRTPFLRPVCNSCIQVPRYHEIAISTCHPNSNGGGDVERVNHTIAHILAMVCTEHQNGWDAHAPSSNTPTITPLAHQHAWLPMSSKLDSYHASSPTFSNDHTAMLIRASTVATSPVVPLLASANNAPTNSCVFSTPSSSPVITGETPPCPTPSSVALNTRPAGGFSFTTPPLSSGKYR